MPLFNYVAVDAKGKESHGKIDASDVEDAGVKLRKQGLYPVSIFIPKQTISKKVFAAKQNIKTEIRRLSKSKISGDSFSAFTRQLSTLLSSGLPLIRSLNVLYEQQKPGVLKDIIRNIADDVEAGSTFSEALSRYPLVFDSLFVNMIKAGEAGGVLDEILKRLANFTEQSQVLRRKIKSAMIYPAVVLFMACLVVGIIMIFVIPKFKDIFKDLGASLPVPTQILLNLSSFVQNYWWVLILIAGMFYGLYKVLIKLREFRYMVDRMKLKIPIIRDLVVKINVTRFARTLGTLITSGVPILQALNIVKGTSTNLLFEEAIEKVNGSIREGETIAKPLKDSAIFPPLVVNMIDVGEETGALDDILLKIAEIHDQEIDILISNITKMLEPLLIVVMAFIVGYIVISMFLPLISMMNALGNSSGL